MSQGRIEQALVLDVTAGRVLRRVGKDPSPEEYALDDDGVFSFSPEIAGTPEQEGRDGHEIQISYSLSGPKVTILNKGKRVRT